jgi:hypothetical protein
MSPMRRRIHATSVIKMLLKTKAPALPAAPMRRRIYVTYEEEDTCHVVKDKKRLHYQ